MLEKQARARGLVKKPRTTLPVAAVRMEAPEEARNEPQDDSLPLALVTTEPPPARRTGPREAIPAAVRRAVWERDGGPCVWPLDGGGCCGSTHLLELDHIHPWARDGEATIANLRIVCHTHNDLAARRAFGARCADRPRRA